MSLSCGQGSSQLAWEVIIVDDASPDGTQEVAKQLATVYGEDKIVSCHAVLVASLLYSVSTVASATRWETWTGVSQ